VVVSYKMHISTLVNLSTFMQFRKVYKILKIGLFPNTYQDEDSSLPGENALESSIPQP